MSKATELANQIDDELEYDHNRETIALLNKAAAMIRAQDAAIKLAVEALESLQRQYKDRPSIFMDWSKARKALAKLREVQG